MKLKAQEILSFLREVSIPFTYVGNEKLEVAGFCSLKQKKENCLMWIKDGTTFDWSSLDKTWDMLIVTNLKEMPAPEGFHIISCESSSKHAFFQILNHFYAAPISREIALTATVLTKKVGKNVAIGHNCYIGPEVVIADDVVIGHNVVIENSVSIGKGTVIQSGAIIGSDGNGYSRDELGDIAHTPHFGGVTIGKGVLIFANAGIDRGTLDDTIIEDGAIIGKQSLVGHNAHIKERVTLGTGATTCGSTILEKDVYVAPCAIVANQVSVGENTVIGIGAVVTQSIGANKVVTPSAARMIRDNTGVNKGINS